MLHKSEEGEIVKYSRTCPSLLIKQALFAAPHLSSIQTVFKSPK